MRGGTVVGSEGTFVRERPPPAAWAELAGAGIRTGYRNTPAHSSLPPVELIRAVSVRVAIGYGAGIAHWMQELFGTSGFYSAVNWAALVGWPG